MNETTTDVAKLRFTAPVVLSLVVAVGGACISVGGFVKAKEDVEVHAQQIASLSNITRDHASRMDALRDRQEIVERERDRRDADMQRRLERIEIKIDRMADRERDRP